MRRLVMPLPAPDASAATLGGKGLNLQRLIEFGLPVPATFVIVADAYREHVARPEIRVALAAALAARGEDRTRLLAVARDAIIDAAFHPLTARDIHAALERFSAAPLAVRSSATSEDAAQHSFAGQHDTFLGVARGEACCLAIRRCWASLWTERAVAYREHAGFDPQYAAMAVVVQRCVAADVAGVLFTCDPVSGRDDRVVIEATYGLGESLVSGRVAPDRLVLDKSSLAIVARTIGQKALAVVPDGNGVREEVVPPERARVICLDDGLACRLAQMGVHVERALGTAQDIEWAISGGRIALLQTRPVTTSHAAPDTADRQVWSNTNTGELLPDVATPMTFAVLQRYVDALLRPILRRFAIDVGELPIVGLVAGRIYFNITTLAAMLRRLPGMGQRDVVGLFGGDREQVTQVLPALSNENLPVVDMRLWRTLLRIPGTLLWLLRGRSVQAQHLLARLREHTAELSRLDLTTLSDDLLIHRLRMMVEDVITLSDLLAHTLVGLACGGYLSTLCRRWLEDMDGSMTNRLLSGVGGLDSAEAGLDLWRLADAARTAAVAGLLARGESFETTRAALGASEDGKAWLERWEAFMAQHGHHTRGEVDVAVPRWREEPDYVLELVRSYLDAGDHSPVAAYRRRVETRAALTADCEGRLRNPVRRAIFRWVLARAQRGVALRETAKSEAVRRVAIARTMLLELGRRFAQRGAFETSDDVFFVTLDELSTVARGQAAFEVRALIATRRAEHGEHQRITPPPVVVGRFDPHRDVRPADPISAAPGSVLRGIAVSPGVATGRARVILRAHIDQHVLPGEILIAPFTDPGWTPYFLPAAGIVMDLGGALSHGSVVAREYGIPAVVNVGTATRAISTGQLVRVDGFRGEVTLLAADETHTAATS